MSDQPFSWPESYRGAVSLTFDDARLTQVDRGMAEFDARGIRCTFYVSLHNVEQRVAGWRAAVGAGHEIGNHTLEHPCSANYDFSRASRACTEDYALDEMAGELDGADRRIEELLGVRPVTFAYPCGETHVGRGADAASYVPLVAERYLAGRGYQHDHPNDPRYCDLAHLLSYRFDVQPGEQHVAAMEYAREHGAWVILSGHETGGPDDSMLNVTVPRLRAVLDYLGGRSSDLWVAPVAEVARWIANARGDTIPRCADRGAVVE